MTRNLLITGILLIIATLSLEAQAQRKTDIVTMYNGDRITGEITSLYGGMLELKTNSMGTIRIEWPEISRLKSKYHYELRLSDGQRLYGSIDEDTLPGQIVVEDLYGKHELEWLQVVEIRPIEDSIAERIDVYLSAGYSYTKASSVGQVSFNTQVSYEDKTSRNTLTARTDLTETDTQSTSSTRMDINRALWTERRPGMFRTVFGNYEDSDELGLDYRIGAGGGLGKYFIDTHKTRFFGTGGLQVITEAPLEGGSNQEVEMFLNASFATWKFTTPELDMDLRFTLYPSLTDWGRVRSESNLRIRWELIEDLYWDITAWASTDNQLESSDREVDYSITTGIGWEY